MATHSGVLAWRIPGMAEPGGLPSIGSHRDGHDWSDLAAAPAAAAKTFKPTSEDHFTEMLEKIFLHGWHEWHIRIYLTKILWMGQNDIRRDDLYLWAWQSSESYLDSSDVQSCVCVCVCVCVGHSVMSDSLWLHGLFPARLLCPWFYPGKNIGVGSLFLL